MANMVQIGHILRLRRSSRCSPLLPQLPRQSRSASDSFIHDRRRDTALKDFIDISVEIRNLPILGDVENVSVICLLYESEVGSAGPWRMLAISAPVRNSPHIVFPTNFSVEYIFEHAQHLKFEICDYLHETAVTVGRQNIRGGAIVKLDELIGAFGVRANKPLVAVDGRTEIGANLVVKGSLASKAQPVILQFGAHHLSKRDLFDESGLFFKIHRVENNGERTLIYRSEIVPNSLHPRWRPFTMQMCRIADNRNRLLEVTCLYRDELDKVGVIGQFHTTYAKLKYGAGEENVYNVINSKKLQKKDYINSGTFELIKFTDVSFYSFLDYIISGTQLHLAVAVDFSQPLGYSEGNQDTSSFLGDFQLALRAIGGIVRDYNSSKLFPALGCGAKVPPTFYESQQFCLNLSVDPICRGLDGVVEAFKKASKEVIPIRSGHFAHVIYYIAKMAQSAGARGLHYFVLTIFTRGVIEDLKDTVSAVVYASKLPISIVFVGIGDNNFDDITRLAFAGKHLAVEGRQAERDIVEFVELNQLKDAKESVERTKFRVAQQALRQLPRQLTSYMRRNNISAKPPIQTSRGSQPSTVLQPESNTSSNSNRVAPLRHKNDHLPMKKDSCSLRPPLIGRLARPKSECDEDDDADVLWESSDDFALMRETRSGSVNNKSRPEQRKKSQGTREIQKQNVALRQPILHLPPEGRSCHSAIGRVPSDPFRKKYY
uniref:C2 domain-containing protein n=1 Tax=Plectus sambesii TaxID=2011161 RepID=A0A914UHH3_9BILA